MKNEKLIILDKLFSLNRKGIKPGLERTLYILDKIGNPHLKLRTIHIAGTNGKGSVCSIIGSYLIEAGYKVGIYTSPHIFDFNERITVNGICIPDNYVIDKSKLLMQIGEECEATFFEITTALAFQYFVDEECDYCVIETGMGGRYDSTNVINPLVSVITSISIDHEEYLGNDIESITNEKAGIIKYQIPVVVGRSIEENINIFEIIKNEANQNNSKIIIPRDLPDSISLNLNTKYSNQIFKLNLMTAIASLELIIDDLKENILSKAIDNLSMNTSYRFRMEVISKEPFLMVDVSHNLESINELVKYLSTDKELIKDINIVFGVMKDKNYSEMLESLATFNPTLILVEPSVDRACDTQTLKNEAQKYNFKNIISIPKPKDAFKFITNQNKPCVIAGSFYIFQELKNELQTIK